MALRSLYILTELENNQPTVGIVPPQKLWKSRFLLLFYFFFFLLLFPAYVGSSKYSLSQSLMPTVCSLLWLVWYYSISLALVHLCFRAFQLLKKKKIKKIIKINLHVTTHMLIKEEQAFKGKLLPGLNFISLTYFSLFLPFSPSHICIG